MRSLSVCIATYNNSDTIKRALDSINSLADEIVVLDSQSTDGTREIVNEYHEAVIYDYEFKGFADMFRTAAEKASNEWVLFVDADEEVKEALAHEIRVTLDEPSDDAYRAEKQNRMWGQWMHATHKPRPILARKQALSWDDSLVGEEWKVRDGFTSDELRNPIHHYAYDDIDEYLEKWTRYTAADALDECKAGYTPSIPKYYIKGIAAFWYRYIYEKAILDGWQGLFFATMSGVFYPVVDAKIRHIQTIQKQNEDWEEWWIDTKL
ncbi:glycosyltransferase family 2 protein [Haloarcula sebkhae]|uniref:Glycosyltransferase family 2 protein n=2 Tax=Haloarcula sebkhae TaxID=932660 RepID=A0ACC6VLV4_9EURY|nr:glycosyltransferase family 2 protein [Haloarcula sebkhae]GGK81181.1 beta 1,4 glucosyltransferase [Haloarcula sebkhae]